MTYIKPNDITYTQMAIYVDNNMYNEKRDDNTCFRYLYFLSYLTAVQGKFFKRSSDYDEYALFVATKVFLRYDKKDLPPIKSCFNYIKNIAYPLRVDYQKSIFAQQFNGDLTKSGDINSLAYDERLKAINQQTELLKVDSEYYLERIGSVIKEVVNTTSYAKDKIMANNIYISCILNLLYQLSFNNRNKAKLENKLKKLNLSDNDIKDAYSKELAQHKIILFHLDKSMSNLISTLLNKIKSAIVEDLTYLINDYNVDDDIISKILASPLGDAEAEDNNEF